MPSQPVIPLVDSLCFRIYLFAMCLPRPFLSLSCAYLSMLCEWHSICLFFHGFPITSDPIPNKSEWYYYALAFVFTCRQIMTSGRIDYSEIRSHVVCLTPCQNEQYAVCISSRLPVRGSSLATLFPRLQTCSVLLRYPTFPLHLLSVTAL